jgi:hypothetical protein
MTGEVSGVKTLKHLCDIPPTVVNMIHDMQRIDDKTVGPPRRGFVGHCFAETRPPCGSALVEYCLGQGLPVVRGD